MIKDTVPLISLQDVTVRVWDRPILQNTDWDIHPGEHWAVLGPNGSGKSSLVGALVDDYMVIHGRAVHNHGGRLGYISFAKHKRTLKRERARGDSRHFSGQLDQKTTVADYLFRGSRFNPATADRAIKTLSLDHLLDRGIDCLSTGEMRKVLIAGELLKSPRVLVLDEPFDGLDIHSRPVLSAALELLMREEVTLILVTHRTEELTAGISHIICLDDCKVAVQGKRAEVIKTDIFSKLFSSGIDEKPTQMGERGSPFPESAGNPGASAPELIIEMKGISVKYDELTIFHKVDWRVGRGENWRILGPNGCGKSTLLGLVYGDNPQAYSQHITLFGRRRGSGESIWDIKKQIGFISSELQVDFRDGLKAEEVVISGFYDSNGLFRRPSEKEIQGAHTWFGIMGVPEMKDRIFNNLSFGEQRLVLLARAMVKNPLLLVLDEPCQGLDPANRVKVLNIIDRIGRKGDTGLLYVTHQMNDYIPSITHELVFHRDAEGVYTASGKPVQIAG